MNSKEGQEMGSVRGGRARWAAATVGLAVGVAALLTGTAGVAQAGGPGYAGGPVTAPAPDGAYRPAPDGAYRMVPLPRPGASMGVAGAPDPGRPGDPRYRRGPGHDDGRGHPGNWRRDDWRRDGWRHDDWRHHGYWHGGRWYPHRSYGYSGWRPAYPGQWVWDGWRWVWVPAHWVPGY